MNGNTSLVKLNAFFFSFSTIQLALREYALGWTLQYLRLMRALQSDRKAVVNSHHFFLIYCIQLD